MVSCDMETAETSPPQNLSSSERLRGSKSPIFLNAQEQIVPSTKTAVFCIYMWKQQQLKGSLPHLQGETEFNTDTKSVKARDRLRGNDTELSWLMRTSYISNETDARRQAVAPRAKASEAEDQSLDGDEAHLEAAEVFAGLLLARRGHRPLRA